MANLQKYIEYSREVQQARENNQPIVALESTIISHGMPYPQNVEMATTVEQIIRNNGAIPATIAIIDGKIKIGLESEDLEILATSKDVAKVSRRDLAEVVAMKCWCYYCSDDDDMCCNGWYSIFCYRRYWGRP